MVNWWWLGRSTPVNLYNNYKVLYFHFLLSWYIYIFKIIIIIIIGNSSMSCRDVSCGNIFNIIIIAVVKSLVMSRIIIIGTAADEEFATSGFYTQNQTHIPSRRQRTFLTRVHKLWNNNARYLYWFSPRVNELKSLINLYYNEFNDIFVCY